MRGSQITRPGSAMPTHREAVAWRGWARGMLLLIAATATVGAWALEIGATLGSARYRSEETRPDGRVFNRESGTLATRSLSLHLPQAPLQIELRLAQATGDIAYSGQTQIGIPLFTRTRLRQQLVEAGLRHPLGGLPDGLAAAVLAGVDGRQQVRAIQPTALTSALTETAHSRSLTLGLALSTALPLAHGSWQLSWRGQWQRPWRQRLAVSTPSAFEPLELRPARHAGTDTALSLSWRPQPGLDLNLQLGSRRWQPGAAPPVLAWRKGIPVGEISYPGSRQKQSEVAAGLRLAL